MPCRLPRRQGGAWVVLALACTTLGGCLLPDATEGMAPHDTSQPSTPATTVSRSPAAQALDEANQRMHAKMQVGMDEAADVLFVRAMIPHHQGAVDMARIELAYGHDPKLRQLAQDIIAAQETEIALMEAWLKEHAGQPPVRPTTEHTTHTH